MNCKLFAIFFLLCAVQSSLGGGDGHHEPCFNCPFTGDYMKCDSGTVKCCNKNQKKNFLQALLQTLGIGTGLVNGLGGAGPFNIADDVDVTCTPVAVGVQGGAVSGQSCNGQTLCCSDNQVIGFIATGCLPFNVNAG